MRLGKRIMRFAMILAALALLAVPQGVSAQVDERRCGDFKSLPAVSAAALEDAAGRGCTIRAKDATITGNLDVRDVVFNAANFWGTTFLGETNFGGATFLGADVSFLRATFVEDVDFSNAKFWTTKTVFRGTNFEKDANFRDTEFKGPVDFTNAIIEGRSFFTDVTFSGEVHPPHRVGRATDLTWSQVARTLPAQEKLADMYGAWENFFASGGQFDEASELRTLRRRYSLRRLLWFVGGTFPLLVFLFAGIYYPLFRRARATPAHLAKVLLFSLDVLLPGLGPLRYDWKDQGGLPVEKVAVLTAAESAFGWLLLALTSALIAAWLIV